MKSHIQRQALELGFDACRFTTADRPVTAEHFQKWLASACHGGMGYLERNAHKRVDPQSVLSGAATIITLATSYANHLDTPERAVEPTTPNPASRITDPASRIPHPASPPTGLIARYARFDDYHDVLGQRLRALAERVSELGGAGTRSLWYVDTGPLLERDLAQRAGLGFVGKHTNLISRRLGNWFFLSEIITTLQLEPDDSEPNRCGTCKRCLGACPTQAITAPFQLDARKCISYLTIELKGSIPTELRPAIGNRIFGCDDCLEVCPWNRFAREGNLMRRHARPQLAEPDLLELLDLDDAAFKARFAGTPILRTKRRGLLRNVCVALGNVGDQSALPALARAAKDPESLVAEHAEWAIQQIANVSV